MDEIEIEVFRADTRASRGISSADIADLAAGYSAEANPAPLVIGHPKSDSPAEGVIRGFRAEGSKLFATLGNVGKGIIDGIRDGKLLNRSMAFFAPDHEANPTPGKLAPRHLGFLGGTAPGIPGMQPLKAAFEFSADDDAFAVIGEPAEAIIFEAPATPVLTIKEEVPTMTPEEIEAEKQRLAKVQAELDAKESEFSARETAFAASQEEIRKSANKSRVAALIAGGTVAPAHAADLETVFNALGVDELEFSADGDKGLAADKLASILASGPKIVDVSGRQTSPSGSTFSATGNTASDAANITARAKVLQAENPGLTFEAAVETVSQEG